MRLTLCCALLVMGCGHESITRAKFEREAQVPKVAEAPPSAPAAARCGGCRRSTEASQASCPTFQAFAAGGVSKGVHPEAMPSPGAGWGDFGYPKKYPADVPSCTCTPCNCGTLPQPVGAAPRNCGN